MKQVRGRRIRQRYCGKRFRRAARYRAGRRISPDFAPIRVHGGTAGGTRGGAAGIRQLMAAAGSTYVMDITRLVSLS